MSDPKYLALGRLRRDTMILGAGNKTEVTTLAEQATSQGRAAEVFIIAIAAYFSEADHNWDGVDQYTVSGAPRDGLPAPGVALNPGGGEQPLTPSEKAETSAPPETIAGNIAKAAEEGPKGPDAGKADVLKEEAKGAAADNEVIQRNLNLDAELAAAKKS